MLLQSFVNYLRHERNYSEMTILSYQKDLEQFRVYVENHCGGFFIPKNVDADIVRCWMVFLLENKLTAASVNRKLSALKSFFKYLVKQGEVDVNPLRKVVGPKNSKPLPYFIKEKAMDTLLDNTFDEKGFESVRNALVIEILYNTGIRRSECVGLKDADVDFERMQIKVLGKRNKERLIPFSNGLEEQLKNYMDVRDREVGSGCVWLLVKKDGSALSASGIYTIVKKKLAEIPSLAKTNPHVLRHSFATSMLNNGAELSAVKELLGHQSLASTTVYTHTTFEELKKMYHAHPRAHKKQGGIYGSEN